ncbi:hypothetical protein AB3S75_047301 [Citrus x aurantiifolia]
MAFCGKLGMLVRQNGQAPKASLINAVRFMSQSQTKLFVGGLSWGTDDSSLKEAFSNFGDITEAKVITERESGKSRGFGFVTYDSNESASSAQSAMDGQELNGRNIRVSFANDRPPRSDSGYGGGNDGSYGGNRGGYRGNYRGGDDGF